MRRKCCCVGGSCTVNTILIRCFNHSIDVFNMFCGHMICTISAAFRCSGGANVGEVGGKAVASTTASFGKKWFGVVRKKRDSNDEVEKDANASITEASIADSFYNLVKDLMTAEDNKSASVLSTTVKSTSGK